MGAAIKLNECYDDTRGEKHPPHARAETSNSYGGNVDEILKRLDKVESAVFETREQVIGIAATIPNLATKTDIGDVRLEFSELRAEVRGVAAIIPSLATKADLSEIREQVNGIAAVIPYLATKAELSAEIGSVRADLSEIGKQVGSIAAVIPHLATKADVRAGETSIIKWLVATAIAIAGLAFSIAKFVH